MRPLSEISTVVSGCMGCMRRLTIAGVIAASILGTFVIVAGAQTNPYNAGAHTNPYGGAQTNPYGGGQTNPYGGGQTRPVVVGRPRPAAADPTRATWWPPLIPAANTWCHNNPPCPVVLQELYFDVPWT